MASRGWGVSPIGWLTACALGVSLAVAARGQVPTAPPGNPARPAESPAAATEPDSPETAAATANPLEGAVLDPAEWQSLPIAPQPLVVRQGTHRLTGSLRFRGDGVLLAGAGVTLDLGGHTIFYGEDDGDDRHGVHFYIDWADQDRAALAGTSEPRGARVTNGRIVHIGQGKRCHGVSGHRAAAAVLDRLLTLVQGEDTASVFFRWGDAQVLGSTLVSMSQATANRHVTPANVQVGAGSRVEGNVILGGNAGVHVAEDGRIVGNFIAHHSFATNGYGAGCYRVERVTIRDNLIVPLVSGRGVALNAGSHHRVEGNVILAWELPNEEYGWELNAAGIRVRYEAADCQVVGNTVLAVGGGEHVAATALYLSDYEPTNEFRDNRLLAVLEHDPDHGQYAKCLSFESQGGAEAEHPATDRLLGNRLRGNHYLFSTSGPDGGCLQLEPLRGHELAWIDGRRARDEFLAAARDKLAQLRLAEHPLARGVFAALCERLRYLEAAPLRPDRRTWFTGFWGPIEAVTLLDFRAAPDTLAPVGWTLADLTAENLRESPRALRLGRTARVRLRGGGRPLPRAAVTVTSAAGETLRAFSDAEGWLELPIVERVLEKPPGQGQPFREVARGRLRIESPGHQPREVDPRLIGETLDLEPATGAATARP